MSICDALEECVKRLRETRTGLSEQCPDISALLSGCDLVAPTATDAPGCDRFNLHIPYGGGSLTWEVLYNGAVPDFPPDFIFGEPGFQPAIERLPHIHGWQLAADGRPEPDSLSLAVHELLREYGAYQVALLSSRAPRIHAEYRRLCRALRRRRRRRSGVMQSGLPSLDEQQTQKSTVGVIGCSGFGTVAPLQHSDADDGAVIGSSEDEDADSDADSDTLSVTGSCAAADVEVLASPLAQGKDGPMSLLARLDVSDDLISQASLVKQECESSEMYAVLKVTYKSFSVTARTTTQLILSSTLERLLNDTIRLPTLVASARLDEYVLSACQLLDDKVRAVCGEYGLKVDFLLALVDAFEGAVVEYDTETYGKMVMLMDYLDFHVVVSVEIPENFPAEPPSVVLRSVYHTEGECGEPFAKRLRRCPWSPRWAVAEMVSRLRVFLQENVGQFQKQSVSQGTSLHAVSAATVASSSASAGSNSNHFPSLSAAPGSGGGSNGGAGTSAV